jgi:hypothetical protein
MCTAVQFTTAIKNRSLLIVDGYSYIQDRRTDEKLIGVEKIRKFLIVIIVYKMEIFYLVHNFPCASFIDPSG